MNRDRLHLWQDRLARNDSQYENWYALMDERERLYQGSRYIFPLVNKYRPSNAKTPHVRNICSELIEAQVDSNIPSPKVTAVHEKDEPLAKIIEDMLRNEMDRLPFAEINDLMERIVPIQGGGAYLVEWDNTARTHTTIGELNVVPIHPRQMVPQDGVYSGIEDMDYIILKMPQTREYIYRRYGKDVSFEGEAEPDIKGGDGSTAEDMVTQYIAYYRNDAGGIGMYSWCGDVELEDLEDYQARRLRRCAVCGQLEPTADDGDDMNYLYMLKEQLTYSLSNLGLDNINANSFNEIAGIINQPVILRLDGVDGSLAEIDVNLGIISTQLQDAEGNISTLQQTAASLSAQLEDAEGNISAIYQISESLSTRVEDAEGNITTLFQTSDSLTSRVTSAEGNISSLQQTATSLTSDISDLEGNYTSLQQTVSGLRITASNGTTSSTLTLTSNGVQLSSTNVQITGMVTFTDLSTSGRTTINGGNITTGIISAIDISSVTIDGSSITGSTFETILSAYGVGGEIQCYYLSNTSSTYLAGGLRLDDEGGSGDSQYRLFLYTKTALGVSFALKLESAGSMSLESGDSLWMYAPNTVQITGNTINLNGTVRVNGTVIG